MNIVCIAYTQLNPLAAVKTGYNFRADLDGELELFHHADELAEIAGRLCYQSWGRPNPATATNDGYLANIIEHQHFSVMEHASFTLYISGVSRSLTHELVRHRHLSPSQVSQRYVDETLAGVVYPPALNADERAILDRAFTAAREAYAELVQSMTDRGLKRKEARQAARSVLPNATETKLVLTGNIRAWREVVAKRYSPHADDEIRALARGVLQVLRNYAPNSVTDLKDLHGDAQRPHDPSGD